MEKPDYQGESLPLLDFTTILASQEVEFLLSGEEKVPLTSFDDENTIICLFFSANWCRPCHGFTPKLVHLYNTLRTMGKELELCSFPSTTMTMDSMLTSRPCRGLPSRLMSVCTRDYAKDYGEDAFQFTRKKREELNALDDSKRQGGKIDQLLAVMSPVMFWVLQILVSELVGKTVGLFFGAQWCPPFRAFTAHLVESYKQLRSSRGGCFEVVLVSSDRDQNEFDVNVRGMSWLAVPFEDRTRQDLCRIFNINAIPALVLIGPDGKPIRTNGKNIITLYGAKAFPFTQSSIEEIEASLKKEGDLLPRQIQDIKHEHVLKLDMLKAYVCDYCKRQGKFWAFSCDACDYDLHPTCVEEAG
ncbi:putative nucleoredoxin 3 [Hibiscus syriacus]|uniref:protein-disulfide reductase n=1 Tax=Hibiscus syriacus TaxID=106335 RepID=A0A6A2WGU8_HIBSY|nr:putative nucleoredoxin 3 [Hibiscus syriacus]